MIAEEISNDQEKINREEQIKLFWMSPMPDDWLISNLNLYTRRQDLTRIIYINELYKKILPVHGVIMEFGTYWGQNMALFTNLRGIHEPYNHSRKIIGFDTFEGFPSTSPEDGKGIAIKKGTFSTTKDYEKYLSAVIDYHESESPINHIKKYEIVKGDASEKIIDYLIDHPETIIALAYFDFDIYRPTKDCLNAIKPYLTKGSIIAFDQAGVENYPGETRALQEAIGVNNIKLQRIPGNSIQSYFVVE